MRIDPPSEAPLQRKDGHYRRTLMASALAVIGVDIMAVKDVRGAPVFRGVEYAASDDAPGLTRPPSGGITLTSATSFDRFRNFNRDWNCYSGAPLGFLPFDGLGWGSVPVTLKASAPARALYMRTHSAEDPAADPATPGTGAIFQPAVPVPGITIVGTSLATYEVPVQARLAWNYLDLSVNADMNDAIRIPIPFGIGTVIGFGPATSLGASFSSNWAYASGGQSMPDISKICEISPYCTIYAPWCFTGRAPIPNTWEVPGNGDVSPYDSVFAARLFELLSKKLKMNISLVGDARHGGTSMEWQVSDPRPDHLWGLMREPIITHAGGKIEALLAYPGTNDRNIQLSRAVRALALGTVFDAVQAHNPIQDAAVIVTAGGLIDTNTASGNEYLYWQADRDLELSRRNTFVYDWYDSGGLWQMYGHETALSNWRKANGFGRYILGAMGQRKGGFQMRRGPYIKSASRIGKTVTFEVGLDGGTQLVKHSWSEGDPKAATRVTMIDATRIPDSALAWLVAGYPAGHTHWFGALKLDAKNPVVVINDRGEPRIEVNLDVDPGDDFESDWYWNMDFGRPSNGAVILTDDTSDGDDILYGRPLRRTIDPVNCPAPRPKPQKIAMDQPLNAIPGAWLYVRFTGQGPTLNNAGTGLFSSSVEASVDGHTYVVPDSLVIQNNNHGYGLVRVPSTAAPGSELTVSVRRVGQAHPDDTKVVHVVTARGDFPDPDHNGLPDDLVADWNALNRGTLFADTKKTKIAAYKDPVRVLADSLGNAGNDLLVLPGRTDALAAPMLDFRKRAWSATMEDLTLERPYVAIGYTLASDGKPQKLMARKAPAAAAMMGSCSFYFTVDIPGLPNGAGWIFQLGQFKPRWEFDTPTFELLAAPGPKMIRNENQTVNMGAAPAPPRALAQVDYIVAVWDEDTKTMSVTNRIATVSATDTRINSAPRLFDAICLGGLFSNLGWGNVKFHRAGLIKRKLSPTEVSGLIDWQQKQVPWQ